jgi:hypothetical protein
LGACRTGIQVEIILLRYPDDLVLVPYVPQLLFAEGADGELCVPEVRAEEVGVRRVSLGEVGVGR